MGFYDYKKKKEKKEQRIGVEILQYRRQYREGETELHTLHLYPLGVYFYSHSREKNMLANTSLISCNFSFPLKISTEVRIPTQNPNWKTSIPSRFPGLDSQRITISNFHKKGVLQTCRSSINTENSQDPVVDKEASSESEFVGNGSSNPGGEGGDWTTSFLLFLLWAGLMYYIFNLTPNQTPSRDEYFLRKLLNLKGDDGFRMNEVLVSLWYIMGLWPLAYSMLLLPTARSSKSKIPVWPFLILSCFGGAYALLPYFVLWRPPPPPIEETELSRWPLNFLESKLTAGVSLAAGLGLIIYAGLANGEDWKEFFQYFRESKFIHATCIDFTLLSTFAPFWVYNDMTSRKWYDKGSWLVPVSLIPFLGPSLYLLLRPSLASVPVALSPTSSEEN
ncbi:hypothetical protein RHMOL_Rhmol06G0247900 [Rhododendron molle]|uniref:Uncharacterized protein n=1 Tax=Rhododendron molle TaxID=49168 RepID=A0ACC0NHD3_RHOML|nr:hypothetical protein RHMOL_Rhmol06G0247900 [Rhododendron molle]